MNVLITQIEAPGAQSLIKLMRTIHEPDIFVVGSDPRQNGFTSGSMLVDTYVQSPKSKDDSVYLSFLNKLCHQFHIDTVLTVEDFEINFLLRNKKSLKFHTVLPNINVFALFKDKLEGSLAVEKIGIRIPKITDAAQGKTIIRKRDSIGSEGIMLVKNGEFPPEKDDWGSKAFMQEYIEGNEYTVDILSDKNGRPLLIVPRRRIKITDGISWVCQIEFRSDLIEACQTILSHYPIPGFSNIQFMVSDSGFFFIEVNLRFAGAGIMSVLASFNYVELYLKHFVFGHAVNSMNYYMEQVKWGTVVSRYYDETVMFPSAKE